MKGKRLTVLVFIAFVLCLIFWFVRHRGTPTQYSTYNDTSQHFSLRYPSDWQVNNDTHLSPEGKAPLLSSVDFTPSRPVEIPSDTTRTQYNNITIMAFGQADPRQADTFTTQLLATLQAKETTINGYDTLYDAESGTYIISRDKVSIVFEFTKKHDQTRACAGCSGSFDDTKHEGDYQRLVHSIKFTAK